MHIHEGILDPVVLVVGGGIAAAGVGYGLKRLSPEKIMPVAILAAGFFVASFVHFSVGPVNVHLTLNALVGVILGWAAFPAIFVALLLQALLFGYGGLTVLGVNTVTMGLPAVACGLLFRPLFFLESPVKRGVAVFLCVTATLLFSSGLYVLALVSSGSEFLPVAGLAFLSSVPLIVLEGFIVVAIVSVLARYRSRFVV